MRLVVIAGQTVTGSAGGVLPLPWEKHTLRSAQAASKLGWTILKKSQGMQSELHGGINKASLHPDIAIR